MNPPGEDAAAVLAFVASEGYFSVPPTWEFLSRHDDRYGDLAGPDIGHVMRQLGWRYTGIPLCVMAMDAGEVVAMGWAARTDHGGKGGGVNLSYAVAPQAEGRGLASLCTSLALQELAGGTEVPDVAIVHAQFDCANLRSGAAAVRLGLRSDPALRVDCAIPATGGRAATLRTFMGASAPWSEVRERARELATGREVIPWESFVQPRAREKARAR